MQESFLFQTQSANSNNNIGPVKNNFVSTNQKASVVCLSYLICRDEAILSLRLKLKDFFIKKSCHPVQGIFRLKQDKDVSSMSCTKAFMVQGA